MAGLGRSGSANVVAAGYNPYKAAAQTPQKKGSFLTHLLPSVGGTAGGVLGGAAMGAAAGSVVPLAGTAVGGLLGALIGGAVGGAGGKAIENHVEHQALGNGVLGAGIENGVLSAGPLRLLKGGAGLAKAGAGGLTGALIKPTAAHEAEQLAAGAATAPLKTSAISKLDDFGIQQIGKQLGPLGSPEIRAFDPYNTIKTLSNAGLTKDTQWEKAAHAITGSNGIMNKAVVKAIGGAGTVSTAGVNDALEKAIVGNNLSGQPLETAGRKFIQAQLTKLGDNPKATEVLGSMKRIEKQIRDLEGAGGNAKMVDPNRGDLANAYKDVHNHLEKTMYEGVAGANGNVSKVLTPELKQQLLNIHPNNEKWAAHVDGIMNSKTVNELRGSQKPFVNISQMIDHSRNKAFSAGSRGVAALENGTPQTLQSMAIGTAAKLAHGPMARLSGNAARSAAAIKGGTETAGSKATGLLGSLTAPTGKQIARNDLIGGALLNNTTGNADAASAPTDQGYSEEEIAQMQAANPATDPTADQAGQDDPSSPLNPANVEQGVQAILAGGGKMSDVTAYVSLVKSLSDMKGGGAAKPLNSTQQQQAFNAQTGLDSLSQIQQAIQKNPNIVNMASLPGGRLTAGLLGTGDFRAAIANTTDVIGRLRSGGAINGDEEKRFRSMLPQSGDSPQDQMQKIRNVQSLLSKFANPHAAAQDPTDLLTALGAQ